MWARWPRRAMRVRRPPPKVGAMSVGLWSRLFAVTYDPFLALGELAGVRGHRRRALGAARGRVVEVGAGTGLNLRHYPRGLEALVLVEPDPAMRRRLARRVRR